MKFFHSIIPLYEVSEKAYEEYKPRGTGILFEHEESNFILTVCHNLLEENLKGLYVFGRRSHLQILGTPGYSAPKNNNDKYDISIIELDKSFTTRLKKEIIVTDEDSIQSMTYEFLKLSDIGLNHMPEYDNQLFDNYIALGYPASTNKQIPTKEKTYNLKPTYIVTRLKKPVKNSEINFIALRKNKMYRVKDNQRVKAPAPWGMSGGGLIYIDNVNQTAKVIGVLKYNDNNDLLATKIDFYIKLIREAYELKTLPILTLDLK